MKINRFFCFFIISLCFCLGRISFLEGTNTYAQLSSLTSQLPTPGGISLIQVETVDAMFNLELSPDKQSVIIKEDGVYFVIMAAQVGSIDQTTTGYVDLWLLKNKKGVPDTNCRKTVDQPTSTGVLVSPNMLFLKAGDRISVGFAASGPSLGIIFSQPVIEPAIPSISFSIIKM